MAATTRTSTLRGPRAAERFELAFLQHAQQFRLQFERQFADFVEEDRAAVRQGEAAFASRRGARERAAFVAEEFAFDQRSPEWPRN